MSLINDALKKAQKQRTGEAPPLASMPGIGGESATRIAKRAKPAGFNTQLIRLGLGAGVLLVLVVGGYFVFRSKPAGVAATPPAAVVPSSSPVAPLPAVAPQTAGQTPGGQQSATVPTFSLPIAAPPKPEPGAVAATPAVVSAPPANVAPKTPPPAAVAVTPEAAIAKPAAPAPKLDNKAITYIENLKIAGIRASATDAKVLMNDRVYRIGDIVEHEMGLKLVSITSSSMTFENEAGARYTRTF